MRIVCGTDKFTGYKKIRLLWAGSNASASVFVIRVLLFNPALPVFEAFPSVHLVPGVLFARKLQDGLRDDLRHLQPTPRYPSRTPKPPHLPRTVLEKNG